MKYYHLTIIRDGVIKTSFCELSSIASYLEFERSVGRDTHILMDRELTKEQYDAECGILSRLNWGLPHDDQVTEVVNDVLDVLTSPGVPNLNWVISRLKTLVP